jgi:hypothetical protein
VTGDTPPPLSPEGAGQLVLYRTEDGQTRVSCRFEHDSVWLTQAAMAELFQTTPQNITLHIAAIYREVELSEEATCKEYLQVRQEGSRQVSRTLKHYNLSMILAVGYRVRSPRGTQFRQWATARLGEGRPILLFSTPFKYPGAGVAIGNSHAPGSSFLHPSMPRHLSGSHTSRG